MKYDDWQTSGSIPGTKNFGRDEWDAARNNVEKWTYARTNLIGSKNGKSKIFTITIDPTGLYTVGESEFTLSAIAFGIYHGVFPEGTEWICKKGRVRIIRGKLRFTHGQVIYKLPKVENYG